MAKINVLNREVALYTCNEDDKFLVILEQLNNLDFKPIEFDGFKNKEGGLGDG